MDGYEVTRKVTVDLNSQSIFPLPFHVSPSSDLWGHLYPLQPEVCLFASAQVSTSLLGMLGGSQSPQPSCEDASCHSRVVLLPYGGG